MSGVSLGELAVRFGLALRGDPERRIERVATLAGAGSTALAFFVNPKLARELRATQAAAVLLREEALADCSVDALITPNPHAAFARIATILHPMAPVAAGMHASAVVAADAEVDATAQIAAQAVVGARTRIGARCVVGPGCVLGDDVVIGDDTRLLARVTVLDRVSIGARVLVHPGAVLGAEGFGFAREGAAWLHVPQVGTLRIGDDVEIGANSTIDRGAIEDTVIGEGVKIDNLVQIGHNCTIGAHTAIAGCVGIAGSSHIGARCQLGGGVGIAGHLRICDDVGLTGFALVVSDIDEPGVYSSGIPVERAQDWRKVVGRLKRIDGLAKRVAELGRQQQDGEETA
ncbi:MAG: UDP-3-O-(3-hydroxymyristoyl)glucosamine N-acyltransferase [Steroidobacteraceae bacterium]|jgi:UDP-3-O-[3-hydroxymyristoyl] glucosamine N-acyltransferase|nr:UDP-3-O-(3-hydroxymyristoyl)glucosamine N-acyltransferase [Gammaproteobacteria bacterium]